MCPPGPKRPGLPKPLLSGFDPIAELASPGGNFGSRALDPASCKTRGTPWAAGNESAVPVAGDTVTSKTQAARASRAMEKEKRDDEYHRNMCAVFCEQWSEENYPPSVSSGGPQPH